MPPKPSPPNVECVACGKPLYRSPRRVEHFKKHYCNEQCQIDEKFRWLAYIWPNRLTGRPTQMADHIGIPHATLRTWLFRINEELPEHLKLKFPKGRVAVGRKKQGYRKRTPKPKPPAPPKPPKVIARKPPPVKRIGRPAPPPKKPNKMVTEVRPMKQSTPFNPYIHVMVKVDNKTWKMINKPAQKIS